MTTTTLRAAFDPDSPRAILAATESTVTVLVYWYEDEYLDNETEEEADAHGGKTIGDGTGALRLSRAMYFDAMTEWLNEKTTCCAGGIYDGEGFILFDEVERLSLWVPVDAYLTEIDSVAADEKALVPGFTAALDTDWYVQMHTNAPADATDAVLPDAAETAPLSFFHKTIEPEASEP